MKHATYLLLALALAACTYRSDAPQAQAGGGTDANPAPAVPGSTAPGGEFHPNSPFNGLDLRYDGYYREQLENILYLIRFFPEGRVVLVNGTTEVADQLPPMLRRDAVGDPAMGYYNEMVDVRNDSLFFVTKPLRGEISYRGVVASPDKVVLLRHSHITGVQGVKEYTFVPDGEGSSAQ